MIKKMLVGALVLLAVVVALGVYRTVRGPGDLWVETRTFPGCPPRPSCVSSVARDDVHRIEPLRHTGDAAAARRKLEQLVRAMPRATIEHSTPEYLHAVFRTQTMQFRDDVELLVQPAGTIQVRSISRFGHGDHGVNRARIERIREAFAQR